MCEDHERSLLTAIPDLLERQTPHMEMTSVTGHFKWTLETLELSTVATGGD